MNIEQIKQRLEEIFQEDKIEVFDSRGTGDHFSIIVICGASMPYNIIINRFICTGIITPS